MSTRSGTRCFTPFRERENFTSIPSTEYGRSRPREYSRDSYGSHQAREYHAPSRRSTSSLGSGGDIDGLCGVCISRTSIEKEGIRSASEKGVSLTLIVPTPFPAISTNILKVSLFRSVPRAKTIARTDDPDIHYFCHIARSGSTRLGSREMPTTALERSIGARAE